MSSDDDEAERTELRRLGLPLAFSSTPRRSQHKKRLRDQDDVSHHSTTLDADDHDDVPAPTAKRVVLDDTTLQPLTASLIPLPSMAARDNSRQRRRRRRCGMYPQALPPIATASTCPHAKYWAQRFRLFERFDVGGGVQLDATGWFSVTPQSIAHHQAIKASRMTTRPAAQCTAVDAMCGCGGNAIALAHYFAHVIAVDNNGTRLAMARNNARIYDVDTRIDFVHGDYTLLAPTLSADVVVLAPEWGGMDYLQRSVFALADVQPANGERLFRLAQSAAPTVIVYILPRNICVDDVRALCRRERIVCDIEDNRINGKVKMKTLYFNTKAIL